MYCGPLYCRFFDLLEIQEILLACKVIVIIYIIPIRIFFLSGYVDDLFEDLLFRRELHGTFAEAYEARRRDDKRRPPPLSHSTPRRPKEDVIQSHVSRFQRE